MLNYNFFLFKAFQKCFGDVDTILGPIRRRQRRLHEFYLIQKLFILAIEMYIVVF